MNKRLESLLGFLPERMKISVSRVSNDILNTLEEIRIRICQPVILLTNTQELFLKDASTNTFYVPGTEELKEILERITKSSFYAYLDDIKNGFVTVEGGHRIGICGRGVMDNGSIGNIKDISFLNIRIANEKKGISDRILPQILENGAVKNTLIISPPQAGKTTLLRDITRNISNTLQGGKVSLIDERGEIAAIYNGIPQNDIGIRTDVLTGIPKSDGMILAIRSLSPTVLITDELGSCKEVDAVFTAINSGVKIITTVHGEDEMEIQKREDLKSLFQNRVFQKIIILNASKKDRIFKIMNGGELR
ncbi:stage III sporulation protein AA [Acetivibrio sp. MSJd-27]|uniref:stage III sporulation protein AA n=1 Tax=Acetivibrio sp. MSJd-27 TaxID=2841523 RepID=UPI001C11BB9F|nr:stage III sporulation protein AA [Acetivibrio sp. MSJd-27]MBU5450157.1 stage III sporulation protein AA [Acetivibrio sp. MSJd-27]